MRTFITLIILLLSAKLQGQSLDRISKYLDSRHISQEAKDYYNGKFAAAADSRTLSILDSVATANTVTRPFYLLLMSRMMKTSDGALLEAIGARCKAFVEQHPNQTVSFLFDEKGRKFLDGWAKAIAGELSLNCKDQPKACSRQSLSMALQKIKPANKRFLEQLFEKVVMYCR